MSPSDIVFLISAAVCILSAILIVSQRNPVYSVVYMLPFFLGMTMIFVLLQATFLAAIQMIVYGGAILVVFLFVIMLINLKPEELRDDFALAPYLAAIVAILLLGMGIGLLAKSGATPTMEAAFSSEIVHANDHVPIFGSAESLAGPLFHQHLIPFELASILIVVAMLGAVLLSKRKI
jgi:NADH-quinone oxidoreductase subunit J